MVNSLQLRVIGTAGLVLGLLLLLWGFLMLSKQWLATGFIVIVIAVTLLLYGQRLSETSRMSDGKPGVPPGPGVSPKQETPPRR